MNEQKYITPLIYGLNKKYASFYVDLVSVYLSHVGKSYVNFYPMHNKHSNDNNFFCFYHCISDSGVIHLKSGNYTLHKDELLFTNYYDLSYQESLSEDWKFLSCFFHINHLNLPLNKVYQFSFTQNEHQTILSIVKLLQTQDFWNILKANNAFQGLLCDILPQITVQENPSPYAESMQKVLEYIHLHLNEELTVEALANMCSFSKNHFNNIFKQHFGMTPKTYIIKLKMETAATLLTDTNLPIAVIANNLAFYSPAHFTNYFKQYYGKTPFDYRHES